MELHGAIADDVTEFIFRPIHAWRDQKLPVSHKIGLTHQAFILGYVAASFGMAGDLSYALETPDALNAIGSTYPDDSVLTAWTNRPPKEWAHYVSHSLQTYPDFHFDLIPHSKPPHSVHSQTADDMVNMYLHLNSQNALPTFCSASVDRRTRQTIQHLLARCFLACFYHLFARSYSRLT
ncbi:unnamed protein product [Dicrocoelium dendriticum]|nr:unnamed protein product [Dicrocoelium dendriticum]